MACNVAFHIITLLQLLVGQSQSLLTRVTEHSTATVSTLPQSSGVNPRVEAIFAAGLDLVAGRYH